MHTQKPSTHGPSVITSYRLFSTLNIHSRVLTSAQRALSTFEEGCLFLCLSLSHTHSHNRTQSHRLVFRGLNIGNLFFAVTQTQHRQKAVGRHAVSERGPIHSAAPPLTAGWGSVCLEGVRLWSMVTLVTEMSQTCKLQTGVQVSTL